MRIGTAEPNSTFTSQGRAIARVFGDIGYKRPIAIVDATFASTENARKLQDGALDFGFMAANWIGRAARGDRPFESPIDLRLVAPMNRGPMYFIARADSGLTQVRDLRGKRVSVGPEHSGTRQHAHSILEPLGLTFADLTPVFLDFAQGAEALARGEIDAQLQCPYPNEVMKKLDADVDLRVLDLSEEELDSVVRASPVYEPTRLRKGSLRALRGESVQPGVLNVLVTHASVPADLVRFAAANIHDHAGRLETLNPLFLGLPALFAPFLRDPENFRLEGVALHPGAVEACRALTPPRAS